MPFARWKWDFVDLEPAGFSRRVFRLYAFATCFAGGLLFAYFTVNPMQMRDSWYDRPDLKPFKAMVPKEEMSIAERTAYESHYQSFRNRRYKSEKKKTAWYRVFFPGGADWTMQENPYTKTHRDNVYNPAKGYYPTISTHHFRDHVND